MEFNIKFLSEIKDEEIKKGIWDILCECDKDFVPWLSSRESSTQGNFIELKKFEIKPIAYYKIILEQKFLLAFDKAYNIVGFMTFINNYASNELIEFSPSNYITTICIKKNYRNNGIAKGFYKYMEDLLPKEYINKTITTRTWSSNFSHLNILESLAFKKVVILKNHRGIGIDTIYFAKKLDKYEYLR